MSDFDDYAWLVSDQAGSWLQEMTHSDEPLHLQLSRLRKDLSTERARLVVEQCELRRRAEAKFGTLAKKMFFTDVSYQQSTDFWTSRYKASRVGSAETLKDYCSGIGGDLMALANCGPVIGWDKSEAIACLANANLAALDTSETAKVLVGDVEDHCPKPEEVWHIDPDRRAKGQRATQLEWLTPGVETIERFLKASAQGIVKLAPATNIPGPWQEQCEREWITWDRECRQQVLWFGNLTEQFGRHRATVVRKTTEPLGEPVFETFVGLPDMGVDVANHPLDYVFDTDPSVRVSGLAGSLAMECGLSQLGQDNGYLTGSHRTDSGLLSCFEVEEVLPLRVKVLQKYLQELGVGRLEIKKRGVDTEPERLRKKLKLRGEIAKTLLLTRIGNREVAIVARRSEQEDFKG